MGQILINHELIISQTFRAFGRGNRDLCRGERTAHVARGKVLGWTLF